MPRNFCNDISDPNNFVVTLELVPGRESKGQTVDILKGISQDAFADGRISAVSITDNPGGNPSLSPDVLGHEIFKCGLDVIVHFACRDMNRVGMESRALQLARMGMKNILALTGDYSGKGFGGQGKPVFDFDSVLLTTLLKSLNQRLAASGDPQGFFTGCAVSPFKTLEAETFAQYGKLDKKLTAGASFVITQLGYDVEKFRELMAHLDQKGINPPVMGSVYLLSPRSARAMNRGRVPGAHVSDALFNQIMDEWVLPRAGLKKAIDRAARLGVILRSLGYRGIHIGGIHRSFKTVAAILDRMEEISSSGEEFVNGFPGKGPQATDESGKRPSLAVRIKEKVTEHYPYALFKGAHNLFFDKTARLAPVYETLAGILEKNRMAWLVKQFLEDPLKKPLLSCQSCGDCAIQHLAFQCPESGCPKHIRNGACGGSRDGWCEVHGDRKCVWVRAFLRLKQDGLAHTLGQEVVPPRMWELNQTSSWVNFHQGKDHQGFKTIPPV